MTPASTTAAAAPPAADHYAAVAAEPFDGGYPSREASAALTKELYFQRAVQTYLWALPAVNMFAMKEGLAKVSGDGYDRAASATVSSSTCRIGALLPPA